MQLNELFWNRWSSCKINIEDYSFNIYMIQYAYIRITKILSIFSTSTVKGCCLNVVKYYLCLKLAELTTNYMVSSIIHGENIKIDFEKQVYVTINARKSCIKQGVSYITRNVKTPEADRKVAFLQKIWKQINHKLAIKMKTKQLYQFENKCQSKGKYRISFNWPS